MPTSRVPVPTEVKAMGLRYVNDLEPGIARVSTPKGMAYRDADGRTSRTPIRWSASASSSSHRPGRMSGSVRTRAAHPATGRDQRGRKQYRYHEAWREVRDENKYGRVIAFGRALPALRKRVEADLARRGLPREKVLAAVVRLLESTLIRVGNTEYARTNGSFGLTTLRDRHAKISTTGVMFEFRGKSGKVHCTGLRDRRLARIVKSCQDVPGQRLFQYLDDEGQRHAVESADVNAYLREAMGDDFSAKDFRTWAGTLSAVRALVSVPPPASETEAKRQQSVCVKAIAGLLGNTPASVARLTSIPPCWRPTPGAA